MSNVECRSRVSTEETNTGRAFQIVNNLINQLAEERNAERGGGREREREEVAVLSLQLINVQMGVKGLGRGILATG